MKGCYTCHLFYQESSMRCADCGKELVEISLEEALELTQQKSFKTHVASSGLKVSDEYKQYYIRSYLGDRSLFLLYDLSRNRLKHSPKPKRFLIQPVNFTALFNIPWLIFNVVSTNIFHSRYTGFCQRCNCKMVPDQHSREECDYNIEYFHILDDILTGEIMRTKKLYHEKALLDQKSGKKNAFVDLFLRERKVEVFFDFLSVSLSIFLWLYIAVYVSYPMFQVLLQKFDYMDSYEWSL